MKEARSISMMKHPPKSWTWETIPHRRLITSLVLNLWIWSGGLFGLLHRYHLQGEPKHTDLALGILGWSFTFGLSCWVVYTFQTVNLKSASFQLGLREEYLRSAIFLLKTMIQLQCSIPFILFVIACFQSWMMFMFIPNAQLVADYITHSPSQKWYIKANNYSEGCRFKIYYGDSVIKKLVLSNAIASACKRINPVWEQDERLMQLSYEQGKKKYQENFDAAQFSWF